MNNFVILAIIIICVSGLIAFFGDFMGRKLGRKRLSLFGLRPKYTAIVISIMMGMLIALATLSTIYFTSHSIREAFITPISEWKKQLSITQKQVEEKQAKLTKAEEEMALIESKLVDVQSNFDKANIERKKVDKDLADVNKKLADVNSRLKDQLSQQRRVEQELRTARDEYNKISRELSSSNREVIAKQKELDTLQEKLTQINKQIVDLEEQRRLLSIEKERLEADVSRLQDEIKQLEEDVTLLRNVFTDSTFSPIIFLSGQEIVSGKIDKQKSIEDQLNLLLDMGDKIVRARNESLQPSDNVLLFFDNAGKLIDRKSAISLIVERLKTETTANEVIITLTPLNNVNLASAAILSPAVFDLVENKPMFKRGEAVVSLDSDIKSNIFLYDIVGLITDTLISEKLFPALREKGIPNITMRFDGNNLDEIPEPNIPNFTLKELITVAEKAKSLGGKVRFTVKATSALDRFSPMQFELDVVQR